MFIAARAARSAKLRGSGMFVAGGGLNPQSMALLRSLAEHPGRSFLKPSG